MKRSTIRALTRYQKLSSCYRPKPLWGIAAGTLLLSGCGDSEPAYMYYSVNECAADRPSQFQECHAAYEEALAEAARTAPKFNSLPSCEIDFGEDNCTPTPEEHRSLGGFMPLMAGFMLSQSVMNLFEDDEDFDLDLKKKKHKRYKSVPMFSSWSKKSPLRGTLFDARGTKYGKVGVTKLTASSKSFKPRKAPVKTVSRGGFGKTVAASRSKGWGG